MAGISSKAAGKLENRKKLFGKEIQDREFTDGTGLDWYDYGLREYNQQIGRFFRIDPLAEKFYYLTPYQYCSNDPIKHVDLDGAEGLDFRLLTNLVTNTVKNPDGVSATALGALAGTGNFAIKTVTGVANLVTSPPDLSLQGTVNSGVAVGVGVYNRTNTIKNGTTVEKSAAITETVLDVASLVVGTKGVGVGLKGSGAAGEVAVIASRGES